MRTSRPVLVSIIIGWFLFLHVAWPLGGLLGVVVDLVKIVADKGYYAMVSEYQVQLRGYNFKPLIRAAFVAFFLMGAWNMKRWGLLGLAAYCGYLLFPYLIAEHLFYWRICALLFSIAILLRHSFWRTRLKIEKPETHIYTGPVERGSHEPKSAVDDLIY